MTMNLLYDMSNYWTEQLDPRVVDLPLIRSSYQVPLIVFAYLYLILSYGPRFMKNKPPYSLKTFIKLYNIVQILGNMWLTYKFIDTGLLSYESFVCPVLDYSYNYTSMKLIRCLWYFFLLKILDYVETIVFVLRKKDNQISTLHIYHHVSTLLLTWLGVRYYACTVFSIVSLINSFIHAMMYTYYLLAAWGPNVQKTIAPIKRWLTISQMVQFIVMILYTTQQFVLGCKILDNGILTLFVVNVVINFYMFSNFYQKTYKKIKKNQ